jgi:hypothetical protein
MYMLVSGGDLLQREAVKRLHWFEFYMTMRLLKERQDREGGSLKQRADELKNKGDGRNQT